MVTDTGQSWEILLDGKRRQITLQGTEGVAIGVILDLLGALCKAEFIGWSQRLSPSIPRFRRRGEEG